MKHECCKTCDALDALWQRGYDAGRYDAQHERKVPPLAQAVVCLLIVMALIDFVTHRPEDIAA